MGLGDWFKKTFGKQTCAFCGNEVGMMKRTKIRGDEFICNDCAYGCSRYIEKYRFTKDELLGHMEYMQRQNALWEKIQGEATRCVPSVPSKQGIAFFDNHGMFWIQDNDANKSYLKELFRYDQVAKYEVYLDEAEPEEAGKPKVFQEIGVDITLVGAENDVREIKHGLRPHPYITKTIRVCVEKRDKHRGELEVNHIIQHFNSIFGVGDNTRGLFSFGPTKQQKREGEALKAMGSMFGAAIKAAKTGEVPEDAVAKVTDAMSKVDDAATGGLAKYSRLADEAEESI